MRKITQEAITAFINKSNYSKDNTRVETLCQPHTVTTEMYLHNNLIARLNNNELYITSAWRETNTTKERLNWILDAFELWYLKQIKGVWYLISCEWDINNYTEIQELFDSEKTFIIK